MLEGLEHLKVDTSRRMPLTGRCWTGRSTLVPRQPEDSRASSTCFFRSEPRTPRRKGSRSCKPEPRRSFERRFQGDYMQLPQEANST